MGDLTAQLAVVPAGVTPGIRRRFINATVARAVVLAGNKKRQTYKI